MKPPSFTGNGARLCSLLVISGCLLFSAYSISNGVGSRSNLGKQLKSGLYEVIALDALPNGTSSTPAKETPATETRFHLESLLNHRYRVLSRLGGRAEGDALEAWDIIGNRSVVAKCYKEVGAVSGERLPERSNHCAH